MNVGKQVGTQDCALFSIAFLTSLAHGEDPTMIRYDQDEMRSHLTLCFKRKCMTTFPTIKKRNIIDQELKTETTSVYCHCRWMDQQCLPVTDVTNGFIMVALSVQQKMTHNGSAMIVNGNSFTCTQWSNIMIIIATIYYFGRTK